MLLIVLITLLTILVISYLLFMNKPPPPSTQTQSTDSTQEPAQEPSEEPTQEQPKDTGGGGNSPGASVITDSKPKNQTPSSSPGSSGPSALEQKLGIAKDIGIEILKGQIVEEVAEKGVKLAAKSTVKIVNALRAARSGLAKKVISKQILKLEQKVLLKTSSLLQKFIAQGGAEILTKLGVKGAGPMLDNTAAKLAAQATRMEASLATKTTETAALKAGSKMIGTSVKGALKIGGGAFNVFGIISMALDMAGVGGYDNMKTKDVYIKTRDEVSKEFIKQLQDQENLDANESDPKRAARIINQFKLIVGPLDKLDAVDLMEGIIKKKQAILEDFDHPLMQDFNNKPTDDYMNDLITIEQVSDPEFLLSKYGYLIPYFEIEKRVYTDYCTSNKGALVQVDTSGDFMQQYKCSYPDKNSCESSYSWPLKDDDTYAEYKTNIKDLSGQSACINVPSKVRENCDEAKIPYDSNTGICKIDREYCLRFGSEWKYDKSINEYNCFVSDTQKALEMLFGTTVVRGITQVVNFNQYEPCKSGEKDTGYGCHGCPPGYEANNDLSIAVAVIAAVAVATLAVVTGGAALAAVGGMGAVTGAAGAAAAATTAAVVGTVGSTAAAAAGSVASVAVGTAVGAGGLAAVGGGVGGTVAAGLGLGGIGFMTMCYPKCRSGFHPFGANICTPDCNPGYIDDGAFCRKISCPDDYPNHQGNLCYPACKPGFKQFGQLLCNEICKPGYTDYPATCSKGGAVIPNRGAVPRIPGKKKCSEFGSGLRDDGTSCWKDTIPKGSRPAHVAPCPDGMRDDGLGSCWKDSITKKEHGYPPVKTANKTPCPAGTVEDELGMNCYPNTYTIDISKRYKPEYDCPDGLYWDRTETSMSQCYPKITAKKTKCTWKDPIGCVKSVADTVATGIQSLDKALKNAKPVKRWCRGSGARTFWHLNYFFEYSEADGPFLWKFNGVDGQICVVNKALTKVSCTNTYIGGGGRNYYTARDKYKRPGDIPIPGDDYYRETFDQGPFNLYLQDDGNLVIYSSSSGIPIWASDTDKYEYGGLINPRNVRERYDYNKRDISQYTVIPAGKKIGDVIRNYIPESGLVIMNTTTPKICIETTNGLIPNDIPIHQDTMILSANKKYYVILDTKGDLCVTESGLYPDHLTNLGLCQESCRDGYHGTTEEFCQSNAKFVGIDDRWFCPDGWKETTRGLCQKECDPGQDNIGGICYDKCPDNYKDIGLLCEPDGGAGIKKNLFDRYYCDQGQNNIAGVCWDKCPDEYKDIGALCEPNGGPSIKATLMQRQTCGTDQDLVAGLCYKKCPTDKRYINDGLTCREPIDTYSKQTQGLGVGIPDIHVYRKPDTAYGRGVGVKPTSYLKKRKVAYNK